jgi:hypothetical protein
MFKLIRLPVFAAIAFLAGIFHERNTHTERCTAAGGQVSEGLCEGARK